MLIFPAGSAHPYPRQPALPVVVPLVAVMSVCLLILQYWYLAWPRVIQDSIGAMSQGRLYANPEQGFFHIYQVWTHFFFHQNWWHLLPILVMWLNMGMALERRLGPAKVFALLVVLAPLTASVQLMLGHSLPSQGLGAGLAMLMGAWLALYPQARLRWHLWYVLPWMIGWRRFTTSLAMPMLLWVIWESARLGWQGQSWLDIPVSLLGLLLSFLASYILFGSVQLAPWQPSTRRSHALAQGRRPLDELEWVLREEAPLSATMVHALAQRCILEQRRDSARLLATYLALRDPLDPSYRQLRRFLQQTADPDHQAEA